MCNFIDTSIASLYPIRSANIAPPVAGCNPIETPASDARRVPLDARSTRQKHSPSSSPRSRVSYCPAALANSGLVSLVAVWMRRFSLIFSGALQLGQVLAQRRMDEGDLSGSIVEERPGRGEKNSLATPFTNPASWRSILSGTRRSSAPST